MHCQRVLQKLHSVLLSSSDTVCILSLLLLFFLARYFDVYLLDSQLLICKLIKFDASHKTPGHLSQLCCFGHVNGVPHNKVE